MIDKLFLLEVKNAALASGKWVESENAMWVFPDGTGIASEDWDIHGSLAVDLGLASRKEYNDNYNGVIHSLLDMGLVRRRGRRTYQVASKAGFGTVEKFAIKAGDNGFDLDVLEDREGFRDLDYEAAGFSIAKATADHRRSGLVLQYNVYGDLNINYV